MLAQDTAEHFEHGLAAATPRADEENTGVGTRTKRTHVCEAEIQRDKESTLRADVPPDGFIVLPTKALVTNRVRIVACFDEECSM